MQNNYHRIIHLLNTLGYFKEDGEAITEQDLKSVLSAEILQVLEAATNPPQPFIEEILHTLLTKGAVKPVYTYNEERLVQERLVVAYGERAMLSYGLSNMLQTRLKEFRNEFIETKAQFTTLDALQAAMYKTADAVVQKLAEGNINQFEDFNKNLLLNELERGYVFPFNEAVGCKLIQIKNAVQVLAVAPTPYKKEGNFTDAYITEMNMSKNYFILEVIIHDKPYKYMFTPYNAMNITTGQHIAGQVILPAKCQIIALLDANRTSKFIEDYVKKHYYHSERIRNLARKDDATVKRVERMYQMAKLQEKSVGYTVTLSKNGVLHFKFSNGTKIVMYPHYIYDATSMQLLFANHVQDMTINTLLSFVQSGLRAIALLNATEKESLYKTYALGYDLRRAIKL